MASSGTVKSWVTSGSHDFGDGDGVKSYSGAHYTFEWSATKAATPGQTTISYNIYRRGRNSSPRELVNTLYIQVTDQKGNICLERSDNSPGSRFTDVLYESGTFTVNHNNDGAASLTVYFNVSIMTSTKHATSNSVALDTNYPYTRCGAPTSVSASGIIVPSGSFTVSWSGATSGISNTINGYDIYYLVCQGDAKPSTTNYTGKVSVSSTATSGSTSITLTNATRGHEVRCAIYTKGTAGSSYYSREPGYGGNVIINSLPATPTITASRTIVPSTGGSVSVSVVAGTDSNNSQTITRYYSTKNTFSTSNTKITTDSINLSEGTYYFWSYDGLEASSSASLTISKNSKPTLTVSSSGVRLNSVNAISNYSYVISPSITITPGQNGQNANSYTYGVRYGSSASNLGSNIIIAENQTSTSYSVTDIRAFIGTTTSARYYQLYAKRNDGLEDSAQVNDATVYYVTKNPTFSRMYNQHFGTDVSGFSDSFLNQLSVDLAWDEGYNTLVLEDTNTSLKSLASTLLQKNANLMYANFSEEHLTSLNRGAEYNFNLALKHANGYSITISAPTSTTATANTKRFRISSLNVTNFKMDGTVRPFYNGTKEFSILNPFSTTVAPSDTVLKRYGLTQNFEDYLSFYISGSGTGPVLKFAPNNTSIGYDGDSVNVTLSAAQFYNILPATINKNASLALKGNVYLTNVFGEVSETKQFSFTANFVETPTFVSQGLYVESTQETNLLTKWQYLKESMPIVYTGTWKSYNTGLVGQIYIKRSYRQYPSDSLGDTYGGVFAFNEGTSTLGPGSPKTYSLTNQAIQTIGQILQDDYTASFAIKVTSASGATEQSILYENIKVKGQRSGQVILSLASYNETSKTIGFEYEVLDSGLTEIPTSGLAVVGGLQLRTGGQSFGANKEEWSHSKSLLTETSGSIDYDMGTINIIFARIQIDTTLYTGRTGESTSLYGTTYSTYSNEFAIYNIVPTVAYRQNHLGINLTDFTDLYDEDLENVILAVGAYSGKNNLYFKGTKHLSRINIENGALYAFVIDGGSWSGEEIDDNFSGGTYPIAEATEF